MNHASITLPFLLSMLGAASEDLSVGARVGGMITDSTPSVTSPGMEDPEFDLRAPSRGVTFSLDLPEDGPVTLTMRGLGMDPYLVVRDASGAVIAEDDNSWYWGHPRIVLDDPSKARTADAISLEGKFGVFEVSAVEGVLVSPGPDETRRLMEEDAERLLAADQAGVALDTEVIRVMAEHLLDLEAPRLTPALFEVVVRMKTASLGPDHEKVGVALNGLGIAQSDAGDDRTARETLVRALDVLTRAVGPEHRNTLTTTNVLGSIERSLGELASAETRFATLVVTHEKSDPPNPVSLAVARLNLAAVLIDNHDPEPARPHLKRALETFRRVGGDDHPYTVVARDHLATTHLLTQRYDEAIAIIDENRATILRTLGRENPRYAGALNRLAICHRSLDRLDEARVLYEQAIPIYERTVGPSHPNTLNALHNLGIVLEVQEDHARSALILSDVLERRRERLGADHPDVARSMLTLARTQAVLGREDEELGLRRGAVTILEAALGPDHEDVLLALSELSLSFLSAGRHEETAEIQRRIIAARATRLGAENRYTLEAEVNLAFTQAVSGEADAAVDLLERVLPLIERRLGSVHKSTLITLVTLTQAYHYAGRPDDARRTALQSLRGSGRRLLNQLAARTESERLRLARTEASRLSWLLSQPAAEDDVRAEHEAVLRWKGRVSKSLRRDRETLLKSADDATLAEIDRLRGMRLELARAEPDLSIDVERRREMNDEIAALESDLLRRIGPSASTDSFGWDDLERLLPERATFFDLVVYGRRQAADHEKRPTYVPSVMLYVIGGPKSPLRGTAGLSAMQECVSRLVGATEGARGKPAPLAASDRGQTSFQAGAEQLHELLFEPAAWSLADIDHIIVSPDQFFGAVPLGILRDRDGRYLIERFKFTYISDAGLLRTIAETDGPRDDPTSILVAGEIDYGVGAAWSPLPGTALELSDLGERFDSATILRGADATAAALRDALPNARVAHLATHGFFLEGDEAGIHHDDATRGSAEQALIDGTPPGARAGLVLAGANDPSADAILTADEVGWLDLSGLDLVVLSACETGLGQTVGGEGMQSLQRAFHLAGARTVIASLWKVDDDATAMLMRDFYRGLHEKGLAPSDALHAAQLALLAHNRATYGEARPWTWGAFVLSGDWR